MRSWLDMEPKGCPFCDSFGKGELIELKEKTHDRFCVYCRFCLAEGPDAASFELAVTKWNRRTK